MIQIITANPDQHAGPVRELFWEYLQGANSKVQENFGVSFDIAAMLEEDMNTLSKFMPPAACLLLGYIDEQPMRMDGNRCNQSRGCQCRWSVLIRAILFIGFVSIIEKEKFV